MWLANAARNTDTENIKKRVDVVALLLIWRASGTTSAATSGAGIILVATQLLRVRQRWRRRDQVCSPTKRRPSSRNQIRRFRSASNCCALSPEVAQLNQNGKNVNWRSTEFFMSEPCFVEGIGIKQTTSAFSLKQTPSWL